MTTGFAITTKSGKRIETVNSFPDEGCPWHDPVDDCFAIYPSRQIAEGALEKMLDKDKRKVLPVLLALSHP